MLRYVRVALMLAILVPVTHARDAANNSSECAKVKEKIRKVHSQMRAGYTRARGERLAAELRRLREARRRVCR